MCICVYLCIYLRVYEYNIRTREPEHSREIQIDSIRRRRMVETKGGRRSLREGGREEERKRGRK